MFSACDQRKDLSDRHLQLQEKKGHPRLNGHLESQNKNYSENSEQRDQWFAFHLHDKNQQSTIEIHARKCWSQALQRRQGLTDQN